MANPPAWHPDPTGRHEHRYWDGEQWTDHVADGGQSAIDPLQDGPANSAGEGSTAARSEADAATADPGAGPAPGVAGSGPVTGATAPGDAQPSSAAVPPAGQSAPPAHGGPAHAVGPPPGPGGPTFPAAGPAPAQPGQSGQSGTNGMAIAALIIGILSLLISWVPYIGLIGLFGGLAALILGFVARRGIKRTGTNGAGMAVTGIVTGALAIILSIGSTVAASLFIQNVGDGFLDEFNSLEQCIEETGDEETCTQEFEEQFLEDLLN